MQPVVRVNVVSLLANAMRATWRERRGIARGLPVPLAASILLWLATFKLRDSQPALRDIVDFFGVLPLAAFAVTCHRAILREYFPRLEPAANRAAAFRFIGLCALVSLAFFIVPDPSALLTAAPVNRALGRLALGALGVAIVYVFCRFSLLFPMLAVDAARNPWASWDLTKGNGWRIAIAAGAPSVFLGILLVGFLALVLWGFPAEVAPDSGPPTLFFLAGAVALPAYYATAALGAAILSLLLVNLGQDPPAAA